MSEQSYHVQVKRGQSAVGNEAAIPIIIGESASVRLPSIAVPSLAACLSFLVCLHSILRYFKPLATPYAFRKLQFDHSCLHLATPTASTDRLITAGPNTVVGLSKQAEGVTLDASKAVAALLPAYTQLPGDVLRRRGRRLPLGGAAARPGALSLLE